MSGTKSSTKLKKLLQQLREELKGGHPQYIEDTINELLLHNRKNADYARGGDSLGNFKRVANILSNYPKLDMSLPESVAIVFGLKQFDAAMWMISNDYEGDVENVSTRLVDMSVYTKIAKILREER